METNKPRFSFTSIFLLKQKFSNGYKEERVLKNILLIRCCNQECNCHLVYLQAGIESALERLCALLPKSARKECDMFVEMYTDQVIQMLLNNLSPDEICTNLGLCKQTGMSVIKIFELLYMISPPPFFFY